MKILSVCVGTPKTLSHGRKKVTTAIFKQPVAGRIAATFLNLEGDGQADLSVHGGRDKAIYAYAHEHYARWAKELGIRELEPSQFGENLTVTGMTEDAVHPGDRYRLGTIEATVAQPRLPCFKLGIRLSDDTFPNRFLASGRLGFYLRVEREGTLQQDDAITLLHRPDHGISVYKLWQIVFGNAKNPADAQHALDVLPLLDSGWVRRLRHVAGLAGD